MTGLQTNVAADVVERTIVASRTFDAPRERVFRAFTEPEQLARWWGPQGWETETRTLDLRPGGIWHYCMRGPDGMESWGLGTYHEVTPPSRFVYTDAFSDAEGTIAAGMPQATIVMEFAEEGGKTTVTSSTRYASEEDIQAVLKMGVVEGLTQTWDRLAAYLGGA
jgi:uncharacterized protein YndB with AHSA1/START domain